MNELLNINENDNEINLSEISQEYTGVPIEGDDGVDDTGGVGVV